MWILIPQLPISLLLGPRASKLLPMPVWLALAHPGSEKWPPVNEHQHTKCIIY